MAHMPREPEAFSEFVLRIIRKRVTGEFPLVSKAEIVAIDVREHLSIGVVTRARTEVAVGDMVVLKRGY